MWDIWHRDRLTCGRYYVRVFGGAEFARESRTLKDQSGLALYCGVSAKYITPNINVHNIHLEYRTYGTARNLDQSGAPDDADAGKAATRSVLDSVWLLLPLAIAVISVHYFKPV